MILDTLTLIIIFIFGASVGSFLNVVAYRSVHGGSIFFDHSKCPHCNHRLAASDLVPILSFITLRGKCRYCHKKISLQYPLVELSTAFLFALSYFFILHPTSYILDLLYVWFVLSVLIVIFVTDVKDGLIPDKVIFPAIAVAFVFKLIFLTSHISPFASLISPMYQVSSVMYQGSPTQLIYDIVAGVLAGLFFYAIILVTRGKAMGGGDVKYAVFLGFSLGFAKLAVAWFLAFLTGAAFSLILISVGKKRFGQTVAFGPFLSIGALIALLWGQQILDWYLRINR